MNVTHAYQPANHAFRDLNTTLTTEWDEHLAGQLHDYEDLGLNTGEEILNRIQRSQLPSDRDAVLITLLELEHRGDTTVSRVLLQAFLPLALRLARTSAATSEIRADSPRDSRATAIAALWEVIHTYPLHRTRSVAGNIRLDTLKLLDTTLGAHVGKEYTVTDGFLEHLAGITPEDQDDAFRDLVTIFTWAIDHSVLTRDEVQLLARVELTDGDPGDARNEAAHNLGITRPTLNRRIHRIRTKLMNAVCGDVGTRVDTDDRRIRYAPRRKA